ncbi:hypothetical protein O9A_00119 [Bartonella koehlerae C-29]|uniref:Uncharacterized protein n=1 Tax=Bartonella koehlerae C-29 TaxID=1134510 RepID=A0A067W8Y7_9HYPH|nr:hypothetical protein O9A_00119 [Bartonella koehlerae C-29]
MRESYKIRSSHLRGKTMNYSYKSKFSSQKISFQMCAMLLIILSQVTCAVHFWQKLMCIIHFFLHFLFSLHFEKRSNVINGVNSYQVHFYKAG